MSTKIVLGYGATADGRGGGGGGYGFSPTKSIPSSLQRARLMSFGRKQKLMEACSEYTHSFGSILRGTWRKKKRKTDNDSKQ